MTGPVVNFHLRIPADVYAALKTQAETDSRSINNHLVRVLTRQADKDGAWLAEEDTDA